MGTNTQYCTNIPSIYAISDLTHGPMLARQAHIAAEVACGHAVHFQPLACLYLSRGRVGWSNRIISNDAAIS